MVFNLLICSSVQFGAVKQFGFSCAGGEGMSFE